MSEELHKPHYFVRHWVAAIAIAVLTCVVGWVSVGTLPIEQYPDIAPPIVTIEASYSGADAISVMKSVVMPIEEVVNGVEDMMYMISTTSSNGEAEIDVYFKQGTDDDEATVNVQNRVSQAMGALPEAVTKAGLTVKKNVSSILTIMSLESVDSTFDQQFISNFLDIKVMPAINRITGVGRTKIMGEQYGVRIWLKPDLMGLYGVTPDEIVTAIGENNLVTPIGSIESATDKIDIEFNGLLNDMSQFEEIVVRATKSGRVLRLKDVATVELGAKSYDLRTSIAGHPGTMFFVKQAPGANATQVNAEIRKVIADIERSLPAGLEFKTLETSDDFLFASMNNVIETLIIAIILVVLVVFFFLQNFKATIIPSVCIIVSLVGTFAVIKVAGFSLNLLTLFALVLAIGVVVDNGIVVVEAVMAKLENKSCKDPVSEALREVTPACISTTLVFMSVFIPVTFMAGTSGTFFKQFGITMASAVGLSAISALTLCPAMCALMLKPASGTEEKPKQGLGYYVRTAYDTSYQALQGRYMKGINRFIRRPWLSVALLAVSVVALLWLSTHAQNDLVPQEDQGFLLVDAALAPGTYLNETEEAADKLEAYIRTLDEVEATGSVTGYSLLNDITSTNFITLMVRLKNWGERDFYSISSIQDSITQWAIINMPEVEVSAFQLPQIPGYGNGSMVSLNLQDRTGTGDTQAFVEQSSAFVKQLSARPEIAFATSSYSQDYPKYHLDVDEMVCKRMGVSPRTVLETVGTYLAGSYIGSYIQYGNVYRVLVQAGKEYRMSPSVLNNIFIPVNDRMVPASQFVTLTPAMGSSQEFHFNLFPCIPITTMPAPGYTSQHVRTAVSEVMRETFADGYSGEYSGMAREEAENAGSNDTLLIYGICVLLIYLIMACLYDSLLIPWAVLLSVPFGLVGSYLFIKPMELMGVGVNIYVQTGIIMLIGLITKTAILITEFAVQNRHAGMSIFEAAVSSCRERLRPILMTVAAMIIGMLPLIIKAGAGAVGNKSLALTVVGGMLVGTLALLFVTPAFYMVFQRLHEKLHSPVGRVGVGLLLLFSLSSCSLYKEYEPTDVTVPEGLMDGDPAINPKDTVCLGSIGWRSLFTDPLLQKLIEKALVNNTDLRQAQLTIEQAHNDLRAARLDLLPTLSFEPNGALRHINHTTSREWSTPVVASWQADIFGRSLTKKRQAKARRQQMEEYRQAVQTSLCADIASTYYRLVMLDRKLEITQQNETLWEELLESTRSLFEAGLYQSPAVWEMKASLEDVRISIVDLKEEMQQTESILCQMLSVPHQHIKRSPYGAFQMPRELHVGIPLRLLSARPDIRQAERNMEVAYYGTQQARQDFYPKIIINGDWGWSNRQGMLNPAQLLSEAMAALTQPLFAKGQIRARYRNAQAEQEKARLQFTQALLNAGNEIQRHLHSCLSAEERHGHIVARVAALNEAFEATRELMNNGTNTYLEVLTAQWSLLSAQLDEVQNQYNGIKAFIDLYTALGGF